METNMMPIRQSLVPSDRRVRRASQGSIHGSKQGTSQGPNRGSNGLLNRGQLTVFSIALVLALVLTACTEPVPAAPKMVLNPKVVLTKELVGDIYTREAGQAISPDGKYMLVQQRTTDGIQIVAVSLQGETGQDVILETVDSEWSYSNYVWLQPIGWTSAMTCVFLESGKQDDGTYQDKNGVLLVSGNVETGQTEELGFIELENGYLHEATYVEDKAKVYLHVTSQLWEVDLNQKAVRLVKDGLPVYDGLLYVRISPTGEYAVYDLNEEDKNGLYILNMVTGEERPLLPTGETLSFLPKWSPDGKYIVAYTAEQKPDAASLPPWERFQVVQGEDSLLPIASELTVVDPHGNVIKTIKIDGQVLSSATWARDSKILGFLAGKLRVTQPDGTELPPDQRLSAVSYESAFLVDVTDTNQAPSKVADMRGLAGFDEDSTVYLAFVQPSGGGLFFNTAHLEESDMKNPELWYAPKDGGPVKVGDGLWQLYGMEPVFEDQVVGILASPEGSAFWLVGSGEPRLLAEFDNSVSWGVIHGHNADLLVTGTKDYSDPADKLVLQVFKMFNEAESEE